MIGALQVTYTPLFEKTFSNIVEVTERDGWAMLVTNFESMAEAEEAAFGMLVVSRADWFVLAYHVIAKGGNVGSFAVSRNQSLSNLT